MQEFVFEGTANWKSGTECDLTVKGKHIATVSPPPEFGGKEGYCVPEEIFAASLASCMNTLFLLIAKNSKLGLKNLETKATVKMNAEGMEKLIFTHIHFNMKIKLEKDDERERKSQLCIPNHIENLSTTTIMGRKGAHYLRTKFPMKLAGFTHI
jgi:organic hydroperoxide reductase OsmC/OhrA